MLMCAAPPHRGPLQGPHHHRTTRWAGAVLPPATHPLTPPHPRAGWGEARAGWGEARAGWDEA
eukprot:4092666-Prymnesium_polylepis.1